MCGGLFGGGDSGGSEEKKKKVEKDPVPKPSKYKSEEDEIRRGKMRKTSSAGGSMVRQSLLNDEDEV